MTRWWMVVLAAGLLLADVRGQCGLTPTAIVGGSVRSHAVLDGSRAVVARGTGLELYDLSDPAMPVLLHRLDASNGPIDSAGAMRLSGSGVMAATIQRGSVWVYTTEGGSLNRVAVYQMVSAGTPVSANAIRLVGTTLYTLSSGLFQVVDLSNPAAPVLRSSTAVTNLGLLLIGRGACQYALNSSRALVVLDCANPAAPRVTTTSITGVNITSIDGDRLWVLSDDGRTRAYDIGSSTIPTLLGDLPAGFDAAAIVTIGGVSYLRQGGALVAADLSDVTTPRVLGAGPAGLASPFYRLTDGTLLTAGEGFTTVDVHDVQAMRVLATRPGPCKQPWAFAGEGSALWVLDSSESGWRVVSLDMSNLDAPTSLGRLDLPGTWYDAELAVAGGLLIVSEYSPEPVIRVIDVSDPAAPRARGAVALPWRPAAQKLAMRPGLAAAVGGDFGRTAILLDLTDPDSPEVIAPGLWDAPGFAGGYAMDGNMLVVNMSSRISAFDVSDPRQPQPLFSTEGFIRVDSIAAKNGVIAAVGLSQGPRLIDASEPDRIIGVFTDRAFRGSFNAAAAGPDGIVTTMAGLIDTSDRRHPYLREWAAPTPVVGANKVAGVHGAVVCAVSDLWIYRTGVDHPPAIRDGFPWGTRALRPCSGEPFELSVDAVGPPNGLTYQWYTYFRRPIEGATSPTLRIPRFTRSDVLPYYCVVTNACGSTAYPYESTSSLMWDFCAADFNCDRFVDFFDYTEFVGAFEAGDLKADMNGDDFLDFFDYTDFLQVFELGCG